MLIKNSNELSYSKTVNTKPFLYHSHEPLSFDDHADKNMPININLEIKKISKIFLGSMLTFNT